MNLELKPFHDSPTSPSWRIFAEASRTASGIALEYRVEGETAGLNFPEPAASATRRDRLWEHTCFEAFLGEREKPGYWELNLSPSGDWNCYRFDGYRSGMVSEHAAKLESFSRGTETNGTFWLRAEITLPPELRASDWEVGLTAVSETTRRDINYWALAHTGARPDFHRRDAFLVRLPGNG